MRKNRSLFAVSVLAVLLLLQTDVFACACCVDRGFRFEGSQRTDGFLRELLGEFKFAESADLYLNAAGFENIRGLSELEKEFAAAEVPITSRTAISNGRWVFDMASPAGKKGTLALAVPATFGRFMVDTFDSPIESVVLYKELRFAGPVAKSTGVFRSAAARGTRFSLVFSGRGNGCEDASQYANWRLSINGPKARFTLFGKLAG